MKKLIALLFCLAVLSAVAGAQQPLKRAEKLSAMQKAISQRIQEAAQQTATAPVKIQGDARLVTVTLDVPEHFEGSEHVNHQVWACPAVIFTKNAALAFDGECWAAFDLAHEQQIGRTVNFMVDLSKFGTYIGGEKDGYPFAFESTYVADDGPGYDEPPFSVRDTFRRSADGSYIIYNRLLVESDSPVKKAIADYYSKNELKEVTAETLSKYFKQKHAKHSDGSSTYHPGYL